MIEVRGLGKKYGERWAVEELTLEVPAGTFFTFLGPNGAGKTTTMKMMAGLLRPTTGSVRIAGFDLERHAVAAKAKIGYLPDHPFLHGKLTGREFLRFVGGLYSMERPAIRDESERVIAEFDLGEEADRLVESYSHGTRQRLAFAACFLHLPRVVIIDEPWVGLDPLHIRKTIDFLKARAREGTTIFMSTHTLDLVDAIGERVGIIHHGRLIYDGTSEELKAREGKGLEEVFLAMTAGPKGSQRPPA